MNRDTAVNIKVAIDKMMAVPEVKKFLEGMCHFRKPIVDPATGKVDPIAEGRRQVYLTLLTINENEPDTIVQLYQEKGE